MIPRGVIKQLLTMNRFERVLQWLGTLMINDKAIERVRRRLKSNVDKANMKRQCSTQKQREQSKDETAMFNHCLYIMFPSAEYFHRNKFIFALKTQHHISSSVT